MNTDAGGVATVTYTADVFGGRVQIRGSSVGAAPAIDTITIRVPGLVQLFEGGSIDTIGVKTAHLSNHWGTVGMVSALTALADAFYAMYAPQLQVNDMSLTWGGKFDYQDSDYTPDGDHQWHRVGRNADIRTNSLTDPQREFVRRWWEVNVGKVFVHDPPAPHHHLTAQ